jgi:hypothetical protein
MNRALPGRSVYKRSKGIFGNKLNVHPGKEQRGCGKQDGGTSGIRAISPPQEAM